MLSLWITGLVASFYWNGWAAIIYWICTSWWITGKVEVFMDGFLSAIALRTAEIMHNLEVGSLLEVNKAIEDETTRNLVMEIVKAKKDIEKINIAKKNDLLRENHEDLQREIRDCILLYRNALAVINSGNKEESDKEFEILTNHEDGETILKRLAS